MSEPPSSPPSDSASAEDALAWYKSQYEQLEHELAEFRESSRELEQELERDIEQAEKRERAFQEKAESVGFEVEEWKVCLFSNPSQLVQQASANEYRNSASTRSPRARPPAPKTYSRRK